MSLIKRVKNLLNKKKREQNQAERPVQITRIIKLSKRPNRFWRILKNNGIILFSIFAVLVYLGLITIGVAIESGLMIAIVGSIVALYFFAVSFLFEQSPAIFAPLLTKLGFDIQNNKWSNEKKGAVKQLRFLPVPIAGFSAYLAFYPSWNVYVFLFVLTAGALFLAQITYWLEEPSNIWMKIHNITKWAIFVFLAAFVVDLVFPANYKGLRDYGVKKFNGFIVWLDAPSKPKPKPKVIVKKVEDLIPTPPPMPPVRQVQILPASPPVRVPIPPVSEIDKSNYEDDDLAAAAEAGLKHFEIMRKELKELERKYR